MRLFVALNFPAALRQGLWDGAAPLRALDLPVRWVSPEGIHLTLKFLGEVAEGRLDEMSGALERAVRGVRPFTVAVEGFGAFRGPARPSVIWAGVGADPALELLQHAVERAFGPLGFPPDGRPFRPHVTLGRVRRDARTGAFADLERHLAMLTWSDAVVVDSADLMRSTTGPKGAVYEELRHGRLS